MILRFNLPNPSDPEINAKVYAELTNALGDFSVQFGIPVAPNLIYQAEASMISVEGDNGDGERIDHEIADEIAQRLLGDIEPFPGESPQQFNDRLNRLRERFREAHPEWKPEKFNYKQPRRFLTANDESGSDNPDAA